MLIRTTINIKATINKSYAILNIADNTQTFVTVKSVKNLDGTPITKETFREIHLKLLSIKPADLTDAINFLLEPVDAINIDDIEYSLISLDTKVHQYSNDSMTLHFDNPLA